MGKGWMLITGAVLIMCMVAGCIGEAVSYTDPEQLIDIGVNEEFVIAVEGEDMLKGLRWEANYDATILELVDATHDVSGIARFKFKALKTGETEITTVYVYHQEDPAVPTLEEEIGKEAFELLMLKPKVFTVNIK